MCRAHLISASHKRSNCLDTGLHHLYVERYTLKYCCQALIQRVIIKQPGHTFGCPAFKAKPTPPNTSG